MAARSTEVLVNSKARDEAGEMPAWLRRKIEKSMNMSLEGFVTPANLVNG